MWEVCAVTKNGRALCRSVAGSQRESWQARRVDDAVDLAMVEFNLCVRRRGGAVACWLGPDRERVDFTSRSATDLSLSGGWPHACVIEAGHVRCWNPWSPNGDTSIAVDGAVALASEWCALRTTGQVTCWEPTRKTFGSGADVVTDDLVPGHPATSLSGGASAGCLIDTQGYAWCWGMNDAGQTGAASVLSVSAPTPIPAVDDAVQIVASVQRTCVRHESGEVSCFGRTGSLRMQSSGTPTRVLGVHEAVDLSVSQDHACVVRWDGQVACWGSDATGESTGQTGMGRETAATIVWGVDNAVRVQAMNGGSCALLRDGRVICWGFSTVGSSRPDPTIVPGVTNAEEISGACVRLATGAITCWNPWRSYGKGSDMGVNTGATRLFGEFALVGKELVKLSRRNEHAVPSADIDRVDSPDLLDLGSGPAGLCKVNHDGTLWCGKPGLADLKRVEGVTGAISVSVGHDHICVLQRDHHARCWGDNQWGQLGLGPTGFVQPTRVEMLLPKSEK